jgi:hypothetical protein
MLKRLRVVVLRLGCNLPPMMRLIPKIPIDWTEQRKIV